MADSGIGAKGETMLGAITLFLLASPAVLISQAYASMACERVIQKIKDTEVDARLQRRYWSPLRAIHGLHCADQWLWAAILADPDLPPAVQADVEDLRKWRRRSFISFAFAFGIVAILVVTGFPV